MWSLNCSLQLRNVACKSFVSLKHVVHTKIKKLLIIFLQFCHLIVYAITLLLRMRVGAVCETTRRIMQRKVWKDKQFYSVVSELRPLEKLKSSQAKLATGVCKNWIFFAVDNFPPCIPVTAYPQYLAPVAAWSTRGSCIWPVLFVQLLLNTWCLSQVSHGGVDSKCLPKLFI